MKQGQSCTQFKIHDEPLMANKGVVRCSVHPMGSLSMQGNMEMQGTTSPVPPCPNHSILPLCLAKGTSTSTAFIDPSTSGATLQKLACKYVLCPTPTPWSAYRITLSSPSCPCHMAAGPWESPKATSGHSIKPLSPSPAALTPPPAQPWHHSLALT